ncbi:MAG TPA: CocE/NonD family hydrolase [Terriglobia bacterium]|nr:CocE/NonD family hydrolase [Terriglobia bacterium]
MTRRLARCGVFAVCMGLAVMLGAGSTAAQTSAPAGDWEGTLGGEAGGLRVVFHITRGAGGTLGGTTDSPDQNAFGIALSKVTYQAPAIHIEIAAFGAAYDGTLGQDGATIEGQLKQGGATPPLVLHRIEKPSPPLDVSALLDKRDVMIPMRDGVKLHTEIYTPKKVTTPLPFLITRTPYGLGDDAKGYTHIFGIYQELIPEGYIFVFQDIRGRYGSEGQFVMNRAPRNRHDPKAIDESTDTYDTIDWLLANVPNNNGLAGELGISYGGWLTTMALLDPHPALKAVSEQASPADMFLGDDFHHNGAFRLSYGFEYSALMETGKTNFSFKFDKADLFDWYLNNLGPLSNADKLYFHGSLPTWEDFVSHPNYDAFWQDQAFAPYLKALKEVTVPDLNVAGWWDQEDFYGPVFIYETLEPKDPHHLNYLVVGPWNHGGWAGGAGHKLGNVDFGSDTSKYFREKVQAPWFAYWLKDKGSLPFHEALTFETGSNQWKQYDAWPPRTGVTERKLYFHDKGRLSFSPPAQGEAPADSYLSDPAHPVPYRKRPISPTYPGPGWPTWLLQDQRFVYLRPDVAAWQSDVLKDDVTVSGDIVARLVASTSGSDSDWIVKLIDVYPEDYPQDPKMAGYQLMISDEVFRGRFRKSFEKPEPLVPNQPLAYTIDLHTNNHTFLKGHRIMVQVQSTWFPLIDRNPQKFVPNIFKAKASDYQKAIQRVYHSRAFASYLELPVASP